MDTNYSDSIVRNLIAKILHQKTIESEDYEIIIDTLQKRNDENVYLIQALKYLNLSSDIIDLLISSYESKELFFFLYENSPKLTCECNNNSKFKPMTQEEALKKNFKDSNVQIPTGTELGQVIERFSFFEEKDGKFYDCERTYIINSDGDVVDFLGEKITLSKNAVHLEGLYGGILGEEFFNKPIDE